MIQINELRIGNYIEEGKVEKIDNSIDEIYYSGDRCYLSSYCNNINPISLTEEWLLKLGFELIGSFYRLKKSKLIQIILHDDGLDVCNYNLYLHQIKYVHQLQNLYFALTGAELTVA